jgi:hypothetical protein
MDHNKEVQKKVKQLQADYKITFGSDEGQRVRRKEKTSL